MNCTKATAIDRIFTEAWRWLGQVQSANHSYARAVVSFQQYADREQNLAPELRQVDADPCTIWLTLPRGGVIRPDLFSMMSWPRRTMNALSNSPRAVRLESLCQSRSRQTAGHRPRSGHYPCPRRWLDLTSESSQVCRPVRFIVKHRSQIRPGDKFDSQMIRYPFANTPGESNVSMFRRTPLIDHGVLVALGVKVSRIPG